MTFADHVSDIPAPDLLHQSEAQFHAQMFDKYGPMIADELLAPLMGFKSALTFRRAVAQGKIQINLFQIGTARTYFALTADVSSVIWFARKSSDISQQ